MTDDIFQGCGVEVELANPDNFLKIKETLTRIGIPSFKDNAQTLYQSCSILHKRGRYVIIHFLEMFVLDGKPSTFSQEDQDRRDTIALLLEEWGLLTITEKNFNFDASTKVKIIPYRDKQNWNLVSKYNVGGRK